MNSTFLLYLGWLWALQNYCVQFWNKYFKKDTEIQEKISKTVTWKMLLSSFNGRPCPHLIGDKKWGQALLFTCLGFLPNKTQTPTQAIAVHFSGNKTAAGHSIPRLSHSCLGIVETQLQDVTWDNPPLPGQIRPKLLSKRTQSNLTMTAWEEDTHFVGHNSSCYKFHIVAVRNHSWTFQGPDRRD